MSDLSGPLQTGRRQIPMQGNTGKLISSYYLEIEYLLERVEHASTHYQALGLERTATNEDVILAYQNTVMVLHPSYYKVRAAVPDEMLVKIDQAFGKVSEAFAVLTNHRRRIEYDKSLLRRSYTPIPISLPSLEASEPFLPLPKSGDRANILPSAALEDLSLNSPQNGTPIFTKASSETAPNRRRCERLKLAIPALLVGHNRKDGKWKEMTKTIDVSWMGIAVRLRERVRHGSVLHVVMPMPVKLRKHGHSESAYNVYAIVRRIEPSVDGARVVGLEFLGEHPPAGYLDKPWATFRSPKWGGVERRREPRFELTETVEVEFLDEEMKLVKHTQAVTENVSLSGARICLKAAPGAFDWVRITSTAGKFRGLACVRNRYVGKDSLVRLCLQFTDNKWPIKA